MVDYSLKDLASTCSRLEAIYRNRVCAPAPRAPPRDDWEGRAVELIRALAEMIIYGERHSEAFFEYFVEKQMMGLLVALATAAAPRLRIQVQVLQTVAILVQNVRHKTSLYLLLSSNYVNALLGHGPFRRRSCDEELFAHFVSLLKTLSLRLDAMTAQFFVDDSATRFPLHQAAVACARAGADGMARTAALTTLLNVWRVDDDHVRRCVNREESVTAVCDAVVGVLVEEFGALAVKATKGPAGHLDGAATALEDLFFYAQDVFDLGDAHGPLAAALETCVVDHFLEFLAATGVDGVAGERERAAAFYVFALFFRSVTRPSAVVAALDIFLAKAAAALAGGDAVAANACLCLQAALAPRPRRPSRAGAAGRRGDGRGAPRGPHDGAPPPAALFDDAPPPPPPRTAPAVADAAPPLAAALLAFLATAGDRRVAATRVAAETLALLAPDADKWALSLVFESERNCTVAHHFLRDTRSVARAKRRDDLGRSSRS
ncbi:hypothetical protein SO694_00141081 [Aureococcus anophagefferens]|uniref:FPL domain-containing protein n=1 Tax=Aureococcus anophagefferens TaxID=44056 RepID=A0ABR1FPE1_AURAN